MKISGNFVTYFLVSGKVSGKKQVFRFTWRLSVRLNCFNCSLYTKYEQFTLQYTYVWTYICTWIPIYNAISSLAHSFVVIQLKNRLDFIQRLNDLRSFWILCLLNSTAKWRIVWGTTKLLLYNSLNSYTLLYFPWILFILCPCVSLS